jgi:hypothetical protein
LDFARLEVHEDVERVLMLRADLHPGTSTLMASSIMAPKRRFISAGGGHLVHPHA